MRIRTGRLYSSEDLLQQPLPRYKVGSRECSRCHEVYRSQIPAGKGPIPQLVPGVRFVCDECISELLEARGITR